MTLVPVTQHFELGLVKLAMPYWGKPRMAALLQAMLNRVQELEDATWEVLERYTLDGADATRLDVLGRIVGQPRFWANDDTYRNVIRGRVRARLSRGLTNDIIDVVKLVTGTTAPTGVEHYSPAAMFVWLGGPVTTEQLEALRYLLPSTRAAGVQLHFFWTVGGLATGAVWDESTWDSGAVYWTEETL